MKTTEYLTGYPSSHYEAELEPIKTKRIDDMLKLKQELTKAARHLGWDSEEYRDIHTRYLAVCKAIEFWRSL